MLSASAGCGQRGPLLMPARAMHPVPTAAARAQDHPAQAGTPNMTPAESAASPDVHGSPDAAGASSSSSTTNDGRTTPLDPACADAHAAGEVVNDAFTADMRDCPAEVDENVPITPKPESTDANLPNAMNPYLLPSQPGLDPALR